MTAWNLSGERTLDGRAVYELNPAFADGRGAPTSAGGFRGDIQLSLLARVV
ncbi:hypothetical protein AB4Y31_31750 [Trinickia sp. EG282A]